MPLLNRYLNRNGKLHLEGSIEETCKAIRQSILTIESEAASRGLLEKQALIDVFEDDDDQNAVYQLFDDWYAIREDLLQDLEHANRESIERHLSELTRLNQDFMTRASLRYYQIVAMSKDMSPKKTKAKSIQQEKGSVKSVSYSHQE